MGVTAIVVLGIVVFVVLGFILSKDNVIPEIQSEPYSEVLATKTVVPIMTPSLTPSPTLTLTPSAFTGNPNNYLPSQDNMPNGFELEPQSSGPFSTENSDGYNLTYTNHANAASLKGDASMVKYFLYAFGSESDAKSLYDAMTSPVGIEGVRSSLDGMANSSLQPLNQIDVKIGKFDQSMVFVSHLIAPEVYLNQSMSFSYPLQN